VVRFVEECSAEPGLTGVPNPRVPDRGEGDVYKCSGVVYWVTGTWKDSAVEDCQTKFPLASRKAMSGWAKERTTIALHEGKRTGARVMTEAGRPGIG